jgi:hypothetical protein
MPRLDATTYDEKKQIYGPETVNVRPVFPLGNLFPKDFIWYEDQAPYAGSTDATVADVSGELTMEEIIQEWEDKYPGLLVMGDEIEEKIKRFEEKFSISSQDLLQLIEKGEAPDNEDVMEWIILLDFR